MSYDTYRPNAFRTQLETAEIRSRRKPSGNIGSVSVQSDQCQKHRNRIRKMKINRDGIRIRDGLFVRHHCVPFRLFKIFFLAD